MKMKGFALFLAGGIVGSLTTYFLLKRQEQIIEEVISYGDSIDKDQIEELEDEVISYEDLAEKEAPIEEDKDGPIPDSPKPKKKSKKQIAKEAKNKKEITSYNTMYKEAEKDYVYETSYIQVDEDPDVQEEEIVPVELYPDQTDPTINVIEEIYPEEYEDENDYAKLAFTLYKDRTVADDMDQIIDDLDYKIGLDRLNEFAFSDEEELYIRNNYLRVDYEILKDERTYFEMTGRDGQPFA